MQDEFWAMVDAQLDELESARPDTAAGVVEIMNRHHAPSSSDAFFPGGGGDRSLMDALVEAGWNVDRYNAWYYYTIKHPVTGDVLTYTEGDVSIGDHFIPDGANFKIEDLSGEEERTVWIQADSVTHLVEQLRELDLGYDPESDLDMWQDLDVYDAYVEIHPGDPFPGDLDALRELVESVNDCYDGSYTSNAAYAEETWCEYHADLLRDGAPDWYTWIDWDYAWSSTYRHGVSEHNGHYFRDM